MGIQEVQNQSQAPAYQKKKKAGRAEGFQESFLQNLKNRDRAKQADTAVETEAKQAVSACFARSRFFRFCKKLS